MEMLWILFLSLLPGRSRGQEAYAPAQAQIIHGSQACVDNNDNVSERVYTIREGDTLVLQCLVSGHPRPQVRWTKTAGSASEKFQETSIYIETLRIEKVQRMQGGRYYCKADNGVGVPAIKSIRVDVQYLDEPILTVHQTISDVRGSFYQEKTVFLRCTVSSNPPARFIWKRATETLSQSQDNGVDIYEPLYTQGETKVLKLKNLRPQDYANYTCQVSVRNVCGIPDKSITFRLTNKTGAAWWGRAGGDTMLCRSKRSIPSPLWLKTEAAPPSLKLSVNETLVVNPGDNVTMQCYVTGGDPLPKPVWSHSPKPMPPNSVSKGGNLTIWNIRPEDSGYYNCTAINNVGNPAKKMVNVLVRSMRNLTYQITPDGNKESETIQLTQDLKLSCHVDAVPQDKVQYTWYKNQKLIKETTRVFVTRNDPELAPGCCSLEILDLKFTDYGIYMCEASLPNLPFTMKSGDINISAETVPPSLSVPKERAVITVREGSLAELVCEVRGKPLPPILWTRVDKEGGFPSGEMVVETLDGRLRLENVTREMSGTYKCQTARYNGFNIRPREASVLLNIQFAPVVEPKSQDIRQAMRRSVPLRCNMLKGSPVKVATAVWRFNGNLLSTPVTEPQEYSEYNIPSMSRETSGNYECTISNDVGSDSCVFQVTGKAFSPEFFYDTPNPIESNKQFRNYSYLIQWTQKDPSAVDPVTSYRLDFKPANVKGISTATVEVRNMKKGALHRYLLQDLKIPLNYEIKITPITIFGLGDPATRIIRYTEPINYPNPTDNTCSFDDEKLCGFVQDKADTFDWIRQSLKTKDPKRTVNTGPDKDNSGTEEGFFMFIEASSPRKAGDKARLLSPMYNVTSGKQRPKTPSYCISFYYHMWGRHIGRLNVMLRSSNTGDMPVWSLSGDNGNKWQLANIQINPIRPFQVVFECITVNGMEGDMAIDDVTIKKGDCPKRITLPQKPAAPPRSLACHPHSGSLYWLLTFFLFVLLR
ncbi:PREDICTED: MAM domain-containing glycosylphosphatidylinositol anchor protein 1 isoform X2 [Nanorana parkeri]|uniref:MAM domain-containing glycosylphosphatidylinositol anchor protein 1 isoform X2 n=1 Tax=Nanorana parkeri TaxID=125878 RepID=UPI0008546227|nr:PREDICTED: MAM domain-containing glycosylphosphatidylinositol anchor protein 1 isoform X2 [Nanorana parkeri]